MYAGVLYTQHSWCSFSSWPHSDITSLGYSVTCIFLALPFFTAEMFLEVTTNSELNARFKELWSAISGMALLVAVKFHPTKSSILDLCI